jgi:hypothetical protein
MTMKLKLTGKIMALMGLLFFLSSNSIFSRENQNRKISIFASGGLSFVNGSDINKIINSRKELFSGENEFFDWGPFKNQTDLSVEVEYNLSKSFGISIGTGCIFKTAQGEYGYESSSYEDKYEREYKFLAIPVVGSLHYDLFKNSSYCFSLVGGAGFYFGKLKSRYRNTWSSGQYSYSEDLKSSTLGFHSGFVFEIKIFPRISFLLNGIYRLVNFKEWKGSYSVNNGSSTEGDLWYYENSGIPEIRTYSTSPDFFTNPRKAKVNISGILIFFALKIYL